MNIDKRIFFKLTPLVTGLAGVRLGLLPAVSGQDCAEHQDLEAAPDQTHLPRPQPRPLDRVVIGDVAAVGQKHQARAKNIHPGSISLIKTIVMDLFLNLSEFFG